MALPAVSTEERAEVEKWCGHFSAYERAFKKWETRVGKIVGRYRDDREINAKGSRFNILWSNVQVLTAATFARLPKPDVSRRFKDQDPVGRVASLLLERSLEYEVSHYPDYRATMKASVLDRFLGGRATAWARYEPHMRAAEQDQPPGGLEVTEDATETEAQEELDYECAPTDYVHYKDFGHTLARNWEEVTAVWRVVYLTRDGLRKRFPADKFGEIADAIPLDAKPEHLKDTGAAAHPESEWAAIHEVWDKATGEALWISKGLGRIADRRKDPLSLADFFPCPKPLYATLANDRLEPTPDFTLYQYQAEQLDTLAQRIEGLIAALRVTGVYDGSIPEIGRIFNEGDNGSLFPVKNWAAYAEKGKLAGAIELVDLKPIYEALRECYLAMDQIKNQIYEITRISDIMRGVVDPREKLGQTQLKGQYGNLGVKRYQDEVAEYATELIRIKAQIICNKFSSQTILVISAAEQLSPHDRALVPQAMQLLLGPRATPRADGTYPEESGENPLRSFRIEIAADSLVHIDEEAEKDARMSFIAANSAFMKDAIMTLAQAGPMMAQLTPLVMELWRFGVTGFKIGKSVEGAFDAATEKITQALAAQPNLPPEVMQKIQQMQEAMQKLGEENQQLKVGAQEKQAKVAADHQEGMADIAAQERKAMAELALEERVQAEKLRLERERVDAEIENKRRVADADAQISRKKADDAKLIADDKLAFDRECAEREAMEGEAAEVAPRIAQLAEKLTGDVEQIVVTGMTEVKKIVEDAKPVKVVTVKNAKGEIISGVAHYANGDTRSVTIQ